LFAKVPIQNVSVGKQAMRHVGDQSLIARRGQWQAREGMFQEPVTHAEQDYDPIVQCQTL
jgi:hypothetical protein